MNVKCASIRGGEPATGKGYQFSNIDERAPSICAILSFHCQAHVRPVPPHILSDLQGCVCAVASIHLCWTSPGPWVHLPPCVTAYYPSSLTGAVLVNYINGCKHAKMWNIQVLSPKGVHINLIWNLLIRSSWIYDGTVLPGKFLRNNQKIIKHLTSPSQSFSIKIYGMSLRH